MIELPSIIFSLFCRSSDPGLVVGILNMADCSNNYDIPSCNIRRAKNHEKQGTIPVE